MKIDDFIAQVLEQITSACRHTGIYNAKDIEITIQINDKYEVCSEGQVSIGTIRIQL